MKIGFGKIVAGLILVNFCLLSAFSVFGAEKSTTTEKITLNSFSKENKTYPNFLLVAEISEEEEDGEDNKTQKINFDFFETFLFTFHSLPYSILRVTANTADVTFNHSFTSKQVLYCSFLI